MTTIIVISQDSSVIIGPNDGSGGPDKSGEDSQSPKGPARSPMDPPKGPSKGPPQAPEEPRARRYNNSLSTVESDESSNPSSAASTLSSGNSLGLELPSGATQRPTESGTESDSSVSQLERVQHSIAIILSQPLSCLFLSDPSPIIVYPRYQ